MANLDWMSDPRFQDEIEAEVSRTAGRSGMARFENTIASTLQGYLEANRPRRLQEELKKGAIEQRSKADALSSVQALVSEASRRAALERRNLLTVKDIQEAYKAKFCQVWPFC